MPPVARVEPLTTARGLRGPYDYLLPESLADVGVGSLLGAAGRRGTGRRAALATLAGGGPPPAARVAEHGTLRRLEARGLVSLETGVQERRPRQPRVGAAGAAAPPATTAQEAALAPVV